MEKETAPARQERSSFRIMQDHVERSTEILPVFVGTIYLIGYIVTATRLAQYGVSTTRLIDAQYFAAGMLPGLLLWVTFFVLISAFLYNSHKKEEGSTSLLGRVILLIIILGAFTFALELVIPLSENWSDFCHFAVIISYRLAYFVFGELALWLLIVGWRTKFFSNYIEVFKKLGEETHLLYIGIMFLIMIAVFGQIQIVSIGCEVYNELPQAYGGGKPFTVQLYVDSQKVPTELLDANVSDQGSPARTIPLDLILQTSAEYIVDPIEDTDRRVWILKADAVYAVVERLEEA